MSCLGTLVWVVWVPKCGLLQIPASFFSVFGLKQESSHAEILGKLWSSSPKPRSGRDEEKEREKERKKEKERSNLEGKKESKKMKAMKGNYNRERKGWEWMN